MDIWNDISGFFKNAYNSIEDKYKKSVKSYNDESLNMARQMGFQVDGSVGHNDDLDAFRHIFSSAIVTKDFGAANAAGVGTFHEVKGQLRDIFSNDPNYTQPVTESVMDLFNNRAGRELGERARTENWSREKIAYEARKLIEDNKAVRKPSDKPVASILDYYWNRPR